MFHAALCTTTLHLVVQVDTGLAVQRWTCDHLGHWFQTHRGHLHNNLGQVVHTSVTKQYNLVLVEGW